MKHIYANSHAYNCISYSRLEHTPSGGPKFIKLHLKQLL